MTAPLALGFGPGTTTSKTALAADVSAKTRAIARDFEATFLNSMFGQMLSNVGNGPFSGGQAAQTWRSFLTDEYAKSFAKKGGIGIADHVYKSLMAQQEAQARVK